MMAFNVFVLDYGMMWVGRRQAQNAADAGALAGATARAYDDFDVFTIIIGIAAQSAEQFVAQNLVWKRPATPEVFFDCPAGVTGKCVQSTSIATARTAARRCRHSSARFSASLARACARQRQRSWRTAMRPDCLRPIAFADDWNGAAREQRRSITTTEPATPLAGQPGHLCRAERDASRQHATISDDLGERRIWNALTAPPRPHAITDGLVARTGPSRGTGQFPAEPDNLHGQMVGNWGQILPVFSTPTDSRHAGLLYLSRSQGRSHRDLERRV